MGQHNVVIGSQHFQHRIGHGFHRLRLMLNRLAGVIFDNAVATNGNDHKLFHVVMSATEGDEVMTNARLPDALRLSGLQFSGHP
ncbi:Uncharacterised protein [Shigella sonnei]|nr:Uncharacterised protein [Shigella sonnei]CSS60635.1 Uncharacterised protein [Shigella sonnei]